ncbi:MAG: HlyD family efflux transporter periplasmic adaptor subunit [Crocosphaera sp.]|nr:HlyD family efflux transporter periplasmic adaptor subunit [Crocosphaera sp.]
MKTPIQRQIRNSDSFLVEQYLSHNLSSNALEEMIEALKQDRQCSQDFVRQQEAELAKQCQRLAELEVKLKSANKSDYDLLATEKAHEQKRKETLEKIITRQRHKLADCEAQLEQYQQSLQQRQEIQETSVDQINFPQSLINSAEFLPQRLPLKWTVSLLILAFLGIGSVPFLFHRQQPQASEVTTEESYEPQAVAALGYIKPAGEVIEVSAPVFTDGAPRVEKLLVKQGDKVKAQQVVAILDVRNRLNAIVEEAKQKVKIAEARWEQIKAGEKTGNIEAQMARYQNTQAELQGQISAQKSAISHLNAQLNGEQQAQKATIERIEAELKNRKVDCDRYQKLFQDGAVSAQEQEEVCLEVATTQQRLNEAKAELTRIVTTLNSRIQEAKANLQRTRVTLEQQIKEDKAMLNALAEVRPVDLKIAEAELESAQVAVKKAEVDLSQAYVRVPTDGQILKVLTWPGEMVNNQGIVELAQTHQMYVKAEIYETDIKQVKTGQPVTISSDQVIDKLQGTVEEIGLQIEKQKVMGVDPGENTDGRVVEVGIRLAPEDSQKVAQLTNLQVNVIIDTTTPQ